MSALDNLINKGSQRTYVEGLIVSMQYTAVIDTATAEKMATEIATLQSRLSAAERDKLERYYEGVKQGVFMYAWWAEGAMQVGTSGKTFSEAILEIEKDRVLALAQLEAALASAVGQEQEA